LPTFTVSFSCFLPLPVTGAPSPGLARSLTIPGLWLFGSGLLGADWDSQEESDNQYYSP